SYGSHNPTVTRHVDFNAWHSGGLQAIDISEPTDPIQAGWFSPTPLASVALEDPALSRGPNKVVMWSYSIIRDGLIYVVDIRNGPTIGRYTGPHKGEIKHIQFLEGNSNLGDALSLARGGGDSLAPTRRNGRGRHAIPPARSVEVDRQQQLLGTITNGAASRR